MTATRATSLILALALAGCGESALYKGRAHEREGAWIQAIAVYEGFLRDNPGHPRRAEILYEVANLYLEKLGMCEKAKPYFEHVVRAYPENTEIAARARAAIFACPNYFPLDDGMRWTYFDSENKGRAAVRVIDAVRDAKTARTTLYERSHTPDGVLRGSFRRDYLRSGYYLQEIAYTQDGKPTPPAIVLRFPYEVGLTWELTRDGRRIEYRVDSVSARVDVRAGRFEKCLKLRQTDVELQSVKFEYLCPDVGLVLTTLAAGEGVENRFEELVLLERKAGAARPTTLELDMCKRYLNLKPGAEWSYVDPNLPPPSPEDAELGLGIPSEEHTVRLDQRSRRPFRTVRLLDAEGILREVGWRYYEEDGDELRRIEVFDGGIGARPETVLRAPCQPGATWTTHRGRDSVTYTIEKKDVAVRVKAGRYGKCLKVREEIAGSDAVTLHYYAPGVGRVLTSVRKGEDARRRSELAVYKDPDAADELPEGLSFDATGQALAPQEETDG